MPSKSAMELLAQLDAKKASSVSNAPTPKQAVRNSSRRKIATHNTIHAKRDIDVLPNLQSEYSGIDTHMLFSCAICHTPKTCPVEYFPFCSGTCERKGSR